MKKNLLIRLFGLLTVFVLGMAFARADLYGGIAPFGLSLLLSIDRKSRYYSIFLLGLWVGALSLGLSWESLGLNLTPYLIAPLLYALFSRKRELKLLGKRIIAVIALLLPIFLVPLSLTRMLISLINALAVFALLPLCQRTLALMTKDRSTLSKDESFSFILLLSVAIMGAWGVRIFTVDLAGLFASAAAIFLAASLGAPSATALGGVLAFLFLARGASPEYALAVCSASILSGVCGESGRLGAGVGYLTGNLVVSLIVNQQLTPLVSLPACLIACGVLFLPKKYFLFVSHAGQALRPGRTQRSVHAFSYKLGRMAGVFAALADAYDEACAALSPTTVDQLSQRAEQELCKNCQRYAYCWRTRRKDTVQDLQTLTLLALNGERIEKAVPPRCIDSASLIRFILSATQTVTPKTVDPQSRIMAGYCRNLERIVKDLASDARKEWEYDTELEQDLLHELDEAGIRVREVMVRKTPENTRITVIKSPCNGTRICERRIQQVLSMCCGANIRCVDAGCEGGSYCISEYEEAVKFSVSTGVARISKEANAPSGDSFTFAHLPDGRYMLALSDGMGSGEIAQEESETTVGFIESFLASGMDEHTMLDVVNQLLILRGREDTYSTADICILELTKGLAVFLKIGACAGFIKRAGGVEVIESGALPMGIIDSVIPTVVNQLFHSGDMLILLSDGILDAYDMDTARLTDLINTFSTPNPQELADRILADALSRIDSTPRDDMTVLAARVWEGRI